VVESLFPRSEKTAPSDKILVGTSGFSYDDWIGPFYPPGTKKAEMLSIYSANFSTVEVNYTFYTMPTVSTMQSLVRKSDRRVIFSVKLNQDITHKPSEVSPPLFEKFLYGIEPLISAGVMGAILAQFPWSFKNTPENWGRLEGLREKLPEREVVVEFRHSSWAEPEVEGRLRKLNLGFCIVDEPQMANLMPLRLWRTTDIAYLRFHGRNYKQWFKRQSGSDRYNYLYSEEELADWTTKIWDIAGDAKKVYVYLNNHPIGQAIVNAKMLLDMLTRDSDR
jgi:uncharacterized protein YecE (DUF72 family)